MLNPKYILLADSIQLTMNLLGARFTIVPEVSQGWKAHPANQVDNDKGCSQDGK